MPDLATVTLKDVEILEAGVAIHGIGSPPEGDIWSSDDLRGMAQAAQELEKAGEWRVAARVGQEPLGKTKLGHQEQQTLLSSAELPAAGWLTNQRVSSDGNKLVADIADVPRKIADLVKAKAYRTRSSELSSVKSQRNGKSYPWVVSGLAWLGGKMPAVRTLDEVHALYAGDEAERRFLQVDEIGVSYASQPQAQISAALQAARSALAAEPEPADKTKLTQAIALLQSVYDKNAAESSRANEGRADTRPTMADTKYTDEQRRKFADATGLEADKVTDEILAGAGVHTETEEPKPDPKPEPAQRTLEQEEQVRRLEAAEKTAKDASDKTEALTQKLYEQERDHFIDTEAVKAGKIEPGQREFIETMYDANPDTARKYVASLRVQEHLVREYGDDAVESDETPEVRAEREDREYEADAKSRGIEVAV